MREEFYSGICAIIKDCKPEYLEEWVQFHTAVGFENIVIYDNESALPIRDVVGHHHNVEVIPHAGKDQQFVVYDGHVKRYRGVTRWCAVIDDDELVVPKNPTNNINDLLRDYEEHSALAMHWAPFGSSDLTEDTPVWQIFKFNKRGAINPHIKSIVKLEHTIRSRNTHSFLYSTGDCVNERKQPVIGHISEPVAADLIQLNHYYYRTYPEWVHKCTRGYADYAPPMKLELFDYLGTHNIVEDNVAAEIWAKKQLQPK